MEEKEMKKTTKKTTVKKEEPTKKKTAPEKPTTKVEPTIEDSAEKIIEQTINLTDKVTEEVKEATEEAKKFINENKDELKKFAIGSLINPLETMKEHDKFMNDTKTVLIASGVVVVLMMLLNLLGQIFLTLFSNWYEMENIFGLIFGNLFIYAGVIIGITAVYYLALLVLKKDAKAQNILGIVAVALIPGAILTLLVSPIFILISVELGVLISIAGIIYSINILTKSIEIKYKVKDNVAVILNTICLVIIIIVIYLISKQYIMNNIPFPLM